MVPVSRQKVGRGGKLWRLWLKLQSLSPLLAAGTHTSPPHLSTPQSSAALSSSKRLLCVMTQGNWDGWSRVYLHCWHQHPSIGRENEDDYEVMKFLLLLSKMVWMSFCLSNLVFHSTTRWPERNKRKDIAFVLVVIYDNIWCCCCCWTSHRREAL